MPRRRVKINVEVSQRVGRGDSEKELKARGIRL